MMRMHSLHATPELSLQAARCGLSMALGKA